MGLDHEKRVLARLEEAVLTGQRACVSSSVLGPKRSSCQKSSFSALDVKSRDEYTLQLLEGCGPMAESH